MPEPSILFNALDERWRRLRKDWSRTRRKYSDDAVHDLRVASRRLMAVLDTLRALGNDRKIDECRRRLKKSLGALSPLRDVHVQRQYVSKMVRRFPELEDFRRDLKSREDRVAKRVQKLLKKGPKLDSSISDAKKRATRHRGHKAILDIVDTRYDEVVRLAKRIDPADTSTIHRTRLAFKRFRYTAELVQQLVKERMSDERLDQLHTFQTMMGDIQDVEVLSARLTKWIAKHEKAAKSFKAALHNLEAQKKKSVAILMKSVNDVYTFWKR